MLNELLYKAKYFHCRFGSVSKVEIKTKKDIDGAVVQTFAFIDLKCDNNGVSQCIAAMANKK